MNPPARYDVKELRRKVSLVGLIGQAVLLKREARDYYGLCPFHAENTASFTVNEEKGFYHCFGCGAHGDALDFLMQHDKLTFRDAAARLAAIAGGDGPAYTPMARTRPAKPAGEARQKDKERRWAQARWHDAFQAGCTPVEAYLMGRGIDPAAFGGIPPTLRYHRALWHSQTEAKHPAMVGMIQDAKGHLCGIHRTYLALGRAEDHPAAAAALQSITRGNAHEVWVKAPISGSKKMLGIAKGGAVRLAQAGPVLAVAEGIETALSVMQATGLPAWAALSLGNLAELEFPPEVAEVRLFADNDNKDPASAERQLLQAVAAYAEQGVRVTIAGRPPPGMDFNDVLLRPYRLEHTSEMPSPAR